MIEADPSAAFEGDSQEVITVECSTYVKKSKAIYSFFRKINSKARAQYRDMFSVVNWKALNTAQKKQHTLSNCGGCQVHYYAIHNLFPSGETFKSHKLLKEAIIESGIKTQRKVKPTQKAMKTAVKHIYSKVNGHFEKIFKVSFAEAQTKVKELQLQKKKDAIGKKRERRERARQEKNKIQDEWSKRDCDAMLATRQSFTQRAKQRKSLHFEPSTDASIRAQKCKNQEALGERKHKRHSPTTSSVLFDQDGLLQEVRNMKDGEKVSEDNKNYTYTCNVYPPKD